MGVRKKSKKSKAKAKAKVQKALELASKTVDTTNEDTFAEIVFGRKQPQLSLRARFEFLCNYAKYGIDHDDVVTLIAALPSDLFQYRDDKNFNLLMRFLEFTNNGLRTEMVYELLRRYTQLQHATPGFGPKCIKQPIFTKENGVRRRTDPLQIALESNAPMEIVLMILFANDYHEVLRGDRPNGMKHILSPEVLSQVDNLVNGMENDTFYLQRLIHEEKLSLESFLRHDDFMSLLNLHHVKTFGISVLDNYSRSRTPPIQESSDSFDELYAKIKDKLDEAVMEECWNRHFTYMDNLLHAFISSLKEKKYVLAEARLWEATYLVRMLPPSYGWFESFWETWVDLSTILESVFPKETGNREDMHYFKQVVLMQIGIIDSIFIKTGLAEANDKTVKTDMINIARLKCLYYEGNYEIMLKEMNRSYGKFRDPLAIDFCYLLKGMCYYSLDKEDDERVSYCFLMIKTIETRESVEFKDFFQMICNDAASDINCRLFEEALKKFELMRAYYPDGYISLIGSLLDPLKIDVIGFGSSGRIPGFLEVLEILLEVSQKLNTIDNTRMLYDTFRSERGTAYFVLGMYELAKTDFEYVLKSRVFDDPVYHTYLHTLLQLDEYDKIGLILDDPAHKGFHKLFKIGYALMYGFEASVETSEHLLKDVEITKDLHNQAGQIGEFEDLVQLCYKYMKEKDFKMALQFAKCGFVTFYNHENIFVCYLIIAKIHRQQRNLDLSIDSCRDCLERFPQSSDAYFELGMSLMLSEKKKAARKAFSKCVELNPEHKNAKAALIKIAK